MTTINIRLVDYEPIGYRKATERPVLHDCAGTFTDNEDDWDYFKEKAKILIKKIEEHYSFFMETPVFASYVDNAKRDLTYRLTGRPNHHGCSSLSEWKNYIKECLEKKEYQKFNEAMLYENFSFDHYRKKNVIDLKYMDAVRKHQIVVIKAELIDE